MKPGLPVIHVCAHSRIAQVSSSIFPLKSKTQFFPYTYNPAQVTILVVYVAVNFKRQFFFRLKINHMITVNVCAFILVQLTRAQTMAIP
jgi:hypothetical protein